MRWRPRSKSTGPVARMAAPSELRSPVDGLLLIDKPPGITSARAVSQVKRLFRDRKVGHGGTLDPAATGLLPILIGGATRIGGRFLHGDKTYSGVFRLGEQRDTDDLDGAIVESDPEIEIRLAGVDDARCREVALSFLGSSQQIPPKFSAIHIDGKRAYERARGGEEIELPSRTIVISELSLRREPGPRLRFRVRCSGGTYVRSLARDVAKRFETVGCVETLRREAVGEYDVSRALPLAGLSVDAVAGALIPMTELVGDMAKVSLPASECRKLFAGDQTPLLRISADGPEAAVFSEDGRLCGLIERTTERPTWAIRFLLESWRG